MECLLNLRFLGLPAAESAPTIQQHLCDSYLVLERSHSPAGSCAAPRLKFGYV